MAKFIGVYYILTHNIRSGLILKRKLLNCREPHISDAINKINLSDSPRGFESSARLKKTIYYWNRLYSKEWLPRHSVHVLSNYDILISALKINYIKTGFNSITN